MAKQVSKFVGVFLQRTGEVFEVLKDTAVDLSWDLRDSAEGGFGLPKLLSSTASLGVAGVAAAGTASLGMELAGKFIGCRECNKCNGWEALRCTSCGGSGKVQYVARNFGGSDSGKKSTESIATGLKDGSLEIDHFPPTFDMGLPLPLKSCPSCDGTGVMTCSDCKGNSWKLKFSADKILDVPWRTWDVYRKMKAPDEGKAASMADPEWAAFNLFGRQELEEGIEFDREIKEKLMSQWQESRRYDGIRALVANREPGWEELQKLLYSIDRDRAMQDTVIVRNIPYYKAKKQIEEQVASLEVPPRPSDWEDTENLRLPLVPSDWTNQELKDKRKLSGLKTVLQSQNAAVEKMLDTAWQNEWREHKVREIVMEKVDSYLSSGGKQVDRPSPTDTTVSETGSKAGLPGGSATTTKARATQKTAPSKKSAPDDQKKKERQERAERMARQAADREAALQKAKAAKARK